jgi:hypothetical protein
VGTRWTFYFCVAGVLAILMVLFLRTDPPHPTFGAPPAAAAALAPSAKPSPTPAPAATPTPAPYPPQGPASNKGDGGAPPPATAAVAPGETWDVRHAPSVDVATIRRVLQGYGSPAVGAAEAMYALGLEYGIDPAFCLAFFINESTAGTAGVARVTKSVGNIRTTPGYVDYQGYRKYSTWEEGIEDWYQLIRDLYIAEWGLTTVDEIIPVYAPSSDGNNPDHYIATVKKLVSGWRK